MWKKKKVSVVFSTYNEKDSIKEFIDGLFKTGYVDEVIAVDNNAAKGTKEEILKTNTFSSQNRALVGVIAEHYTNQRAT